MDKAFQTWTWYNKPDVRSPLAAVYLNRINTGLDTVDTRVVNMDTSKANQSDLLQSLKTVQYNSTTGVFTFTYWNGTTVTVDLNIEKIPVSFSMSNAGVITMTTADGTTYTADVGDLIKTYTFDDTSTIDFTTTTDADGNKIVTATVKDGSITGSKLEPNYLANVTAQAQTASSAANSATSSANDADYDAKLAQSYAVGGTGIRQGEDTDNAKYYKEQAAAIVGSSGHVIVDGSGNTMPQRATLQFLGSVGTDDSTNDITKISISASISDADWATINTMLATA